MTLGRVAMTALLLAVIAPAVAWGEDRAVLRGSVKQELILDEALLKSLPAVTVDVTFETGDRVRTDTGKDGRFVVFSFDGKSAFVQLDGSGPCSTFPIDAVTPLTRLTQVR